MNQVTTGRRIKRNIIRFHCLPPLLLLLSIHYGTSSSSSSSEASWMVETYPIPHGRYNEDLRCRCIKFSYYDPGPLLISKEPGETIMFHDNDRMIMMIQKNEYHRKEDDIDINATTTTTMPSSSSLPSSFFNVSLRIQYGILPSQDKVNPKGKEEQTPSSVIDQQTPSSVIDQQTPSSVIDKWGSSCCHITSTSNEKPLVMILSELYPYTERGSITFDYSLDHPSTKLSNTVISRTFDYRLNDPYSKLLNTVMNMTRSLLRNGSYNDAIIYFIEQVDENDALIEAINQFDRSTLLAERHNHPVVWNITNDERARYECILALVAFIFSLMYKIRERDVTMKKKTRICEKVINPIA